MCRDTPSILPSATGRYSQSELSASNHGLWWSLPPWLTRAWTYSIISGLDYLTDQKSLSKISIEKKSNVPAHASNSCPQKSLSRTQMLRDHALSHQSEYSRILPSCPISWNPSFKAITKHSNWFLLTLNSGSLRSPLR
jgi:hypothetical protein